MGRSRSAPWPGHSPAYRLQPFSLGASVDAVMASEHLQEVSQYDLDTVVARVLRIVIGEPGGQPVVHSQLRLASRDVLDARSVPRQTHRNIYVGPV